LPARSPGSRSPRPPSRHRNGTRTRGSLLTFLVVGSGTLAAQHASPAPELDRTFARFWSAETTAALDSAAAEIVASRAPFDTVFARLKAGRTYSGDAPRGRLDLINRMPDGLEYHYTVVIPSNYDSGRKYPVRMFLHGGVDREDRSRGTQWNLDEFGGADWIAVFPSAWREAKWWQATQVDNLRGILDRLKRRYNIDENRIYLLGMSDGGTGVYFLGMKDPTPWAALLTFMGHPSVLANERAGHDGQLYISNLANVPLFVVNGTRDPLYPAYQLEPFIDLFRESGATVRFVELETGHNFRWWPSQSDTVGQFLEAHPRNPFPDRLSWETERADRYQRARWVVIDELGVARDESRLPDANTVAAPRPRPALGVGVEDAGSGVRLTRIDPASIAAGAGLAVGDVIVSVGNAATPSTDALIEALREVDYGQRAAFSVRRSGSVKVVSVMYPQPPPLEPPLLVYPHDRPSGRVELERIGNEVEVRTRGVRRYSLLLSTLQFDLARPVVVRTNGHLSFSGVVPRSTEVLARWSARDNDRAMLFAAELEIDLSK